MNGIGGLTQITVQWPHMLWLLALLPLFIALYFALVRRAGRARTRLPGLENAVAAGRAGASLRRIVPPLLFLLALFALIGAVSRPQANVVLPSMHRDVVLVLDISGSMRATDVKPNRLEAAQRAARAFIEHQPAHSRIGIVAMAGSASVVQAPTDEREELFRAIDRLQLQRGTAVGSGIYIALSTLLPDADIDIEKLVANRPGNPGPKGSNRGRTAREREPVPVGSNHSVAIVLLSDGENNAGPDPLKAAKLAAQYGVRIYTVGVGTAEGITLGFSGWSMRVRLDEDALRKIAAATGGEYYAATSATELQNIYGQLSTRMVIERSRTVEVTAFLVGIGALLLAISAMCSVLWFNRVL